MAENSGVVYMGPGKVEVQDIDFPSFELGTGRPGGGALGAAARRGRRHGRRPDPRAPRGYGPLRAVMLGSVSRRVAGEVRCPVIVLPPGATTPLEDLVAEASDAVAP